MRSIIPALLFSALFFLTGCPKNEPEPDGNDNRVQLERNINIRFDVASRGKIECGKPFAIQGIPFIIEKKEELDQSCYFSSDNTILRLRYGSEFTIDLSKYNNIKTISLGIIHINAYGGPGASEVLVYDLNDKVITQKVTSSYQDEVTFRDDLRNVKKVVIKGWAETTDVRSLFLERK